MSVSGEAIYRTQGTLEPPVSVFVRDISRRKLHFITTEPIVGGTRLDLTIRISNLDKPLTATGTVLWQRRVGSQFLRDTCVEFSAVSGAQQSKLAVFLRQIVDTSVADRDLVRCGMVTAVRCCHRLEPAQSFEATSGDIGIRGMKLFVNESLRADTELLLQWSLPEETEIVATPATVMWQAPDGWVGMRFGRIADEVTERIRAYIDRHLHPVEDADGVG